jgi:hypothetical protein
MRTTIPIRFAGGAMDDFADGTSDVTDRHPTSWKVQRLRHARVIALDRRRYVTGVSQAFDRAGVSWINIAVVPKRLAITRFVYGASNILHCIIILAAGAQRIDGELRQATERGMTCPEIIDRDAHSGLAQ